MLKRSVTYEDFDGNTVTEDHHFHLSKAELLQLEAGKKGGLREHIQSIMAAGDTETLFAEFKRIVLLAYGVRSEDGKRFIKTDQMREEFAQTEAYSQLYFELATDDTAAAEFILGVVPREFGRGISTDDIKGLVAEADERNIEEGVYPAEPALAPPPPPVAIETEGDNHESE